MPWLPHLTDIQKRQTAPNRPKVGPVVLPKALSSLAGLLAHLLSIHASFCCCYFWRSVCPCVWWVCQSVLFVLLCLLMLLPACLCVCSSVSVCLPWMPALLCVLWMHCLLKQQPTSAEFSLVQHIMQGVQLIKHLAAAMLPTKSVCLLSHTFTGVGDSSPASAERQPGSEPPQEASTSGRSEADSAGAPAQIGIIMGSDSDLKTMAAAEEVRPCLI